MSTKKPEAAQSAKESKTEVKVRQAMDPVAKLLGTSRTVAYRPEFAHITGSPTAGLLLSQFWYWSECKTTEKRDGWFYMTMDQISEQTGMIREEQETARKRLKAVGVLQEERKSTGRGKPACMWFRIDEERLYELLKRYVEVVNAGIPQCDNPADKNAGIPQSKVRELRNLARGNPTIANAGIPQYLILESSSGDVSIDVSGDAQDPPINPPEGETEAPLPIVSTPHSEVWSEVCRSLEQTMNIPAFNTLIKPAQLLTLTTTGEAVTATIKTNGKFSRDMLQNRYGGEITAAFQQAGYGVELRFVAG